MEGNFGSMIDEADLEKLREMSSSKLEENKTKSIAQVSVPFEFFGCAMSWYGGIPSSLQITDSRVNQVKFAFSKIRKVFIKLNAVIRLATLMSLPRSCLILVASSLMPGLTLEETTGCWTCSLVGT